MKLRTIEVTIAIAAIVVSGLALGVSFWGVSQTREQARLSVRPYVIVTPSLDESGGKIGLYVSNAGIGPGIVTNITITIGQLSYSRLGPSIWPKFIRDMHGNPLCYRTGWPLQNAVLKIGEDDPLLAVAATAPPLCKLEMLKILAGQKIRAHIEYESIYHDKFVFDGDVNMNDATAENLAWLTSKLEGEIAELKNQLAEAQRNSALHGVSPSQNPPFQSPGGATQ